MLTLASLSDKPQAVIQSALIRAKMCELMAGPLKLNGEILFLTGMLSKLDVILDIPLPEALAMLPLPEEITQSVLTRQTLSGQLVSYVAPYEQWPPESENFVQLDIETINQAYLQSLAWATEILGAAS